MTKQKKILFVIGSKAASGYYRMKLPCLALRQKGYTADFVMYNTVDPIKLTAAKETDGEPVLYDLKKADIVVFQLIVYEALISVVKQLKKLKVTTIMEVDDAYKFLPANNPAWRSLHPKTLLMKDRDGNQVFNVFKERVNNSLRNMFTAMKLVDILQVSTPELKEQYSDLNNNIVVLPNCIDTQLYSNINKPKNKKTTIIWSGTKTHIDDLYQLNGCIPENAKLIIGGFTEAKDKGLFKDHPDVSFIEGVKFEDYPEKMVALGDIVAIPLVDNKFNAGKSDIKGLEHAALSIPCVASDVAPYRRWVQDGQNGFIVKKNRPRNWIKYLQMLVNDKDLREAMGRVAKARAMDRDIRKNINLWEEVYFG